MVLPVLSQRTYPSAGIPRTAPEPRRIIGDDEARFWSKVDVPFRPGACWTWLGGRNGDGYGAFRVGVHARGAHRWLHERLVGPLPVGMELDHLCRNRQCVRPDHLEVVDHRTNVLRGDAPAAKILRRETCPRGHTYDRLESGRFRRCSICRRENRRKH
jgi:hypothetical protein